MNELLNDRYEVVRVLGEGALGRTMLALDQHRAGMEVAVKELLPSRMKRWKDYDLFHRECRTLRNLSHPGIPSFYDQFTIEPPDHDETTPARLFLVQEYVNGCSLQDLLDDGEVSTRRACARSRARFSKCSTTCSDSVISDDKSSSHRCPKPTVFSPLRTRPSRTGRAIVHDSC